MNSNSNPDPGGLDAERARLQLAVVEDSHPYPRRRGRGGHGGRGVVERWLLAGMAPGDIRFLKSRAVSDATGLTAREAGMAFYAMMILPNGSGLRVSKWGYSKSTTWKVELHAVGEGSR